LVDERACSDTSATVTTGKDSTTSDDDRWNARVINTIIAHTGAAAIEKKGRLEAVWRVEVQSPVPVSIRSISLLILCHDRGEGGSRLGSGVTALLL